MANRNRYRRRETDLKDIYRQVTTYLEQGLEDDPIYSWIVDETWRRDMSAAQITAEQGRFLTLLVRLSGARHILEIGALGGYSGVWLARALPSNGRLTTLEINPRHADLARETYSQAGVADRIELHVGPALDTLVKLELQEPLDLVFIDADKSSSRAYFEWALEHVRSGGLIIVDNVLANGRVTREATDSGYATAVRQFNEYVFARHEGWHTIIPFYKPDEDNLDGMLIYHHP